VLWGGLLLAVALLLLVSFAGPVVRPVGAFLGGVGFGLFIDEIGKFLTDDNDYFYEPAFAFMYATIVVLVLAADWLHRRNPHHAREHLAGAADYAVSGIAGGLSTRARADAERLARLGRDAPQAAEVRALLAAIDHDDVELVDPIGAVARRSGEAVRGVVRAGWATGAALSLLASSVVLSFLAVLTTLEEARAAGVVWLSFAALVSIGLAALAGLRGLMWLRRDRVVAFLWWRRAALLSLLLTQVAVFRFLPAQGMIGLALDLALLAVAAGERWRLREDAREHAVV
jgi:hypothetical protein